MASVAEGVFGDGLPWGMVASGAGIGVLIILFDEYLKAAQKAWRAPVLAVAVGLYLPPRAFRPHTHRRADRARSRTVIGRSRARAGGACCSPQG